MRKATFLFVFLVSIQLLMAQKHYERLGKIDIQHYRFELILSDDNDEITGIAHITVKFKKETDQLNLDLVEKTGRKGMEVLRVSIDNEAIAHAHENNMLKVDYKGKIGELVTFSIVYKGVPQTGLIISQNKYGDRTFFGDNWPDRAKHWLPTVDHPSDKATVEWIVTAPSHYQVIGNGRLKERTNINDQLTLTHWASDVVIPTKVMVIGAARFAIQESDEIYGVPITAWVYPQDREKGFYDYALAVPVMDWFINHVGPYPYAKLANVQSKTQFGGMENASNIFYAEKSVTGKRTSEGLIAHEIAHQWFGNSASEANWHHVWLSEGFATYFTNLYMEHQYGRAKLKQLVEEQRTRVIAYSKEKNVPVVNSAIENYMELLNPNSYQKGAWVLHMLRKKVGDELFWKSIREYYQKFAFSNAYSSDLKEVFEKNSGLDLDQFFSQWLMQEGQPEIVIDWSYEQNELNVSFSQIQKEDFYFELEIDLIFSDGSKERRVISINQKEQVWNPRLAREPVELIIDPESWLLFAHQLKRK